jgi:predicted peroxiredoxin
MADKLGILVSSDKHLDHIVGLTKAAIDKGKEVHVFFTGEGVKLCPDPKAQELVKAGAKVSLCDKTYQGLGLNKEHGDQIEGMEHGSQDNNADIIEEVDRYVVF